MDAAEPLQAVPPHDGEQDEQSNCFAWRTIAVCDKCEEEAPLILMAVWEHAGWESCSWCRHAYSSTVCDDRSSGAAAQQCTS